MNNDPFNKWHNIKQDIPITYYNISWISSWHHCCTQAQTAEKKWGISSEILWNHPIFDHMTIYRRREATENRQRVLPWLGITVEDWLLRMSLRCFWRSGRAARVLYRSCECHGGRNTTAQCHCRWINLYRSIEVWWTPSLDWQALSHIS